MITNIFFATNRYVLEFNKRRSGFLTRELAQKVDDKIWVGRLL